MIFDELPELVAVLEDVGGDDHDGGMEPTAPVSGWQHFAKARDPTVEVASTRRQDCSRWLKTHRGADKRYVFVTS